MFDKLRYRTIGVQSNIPDYLQNIIWYLIETMDVEEKDYLQVFYLRTVQEKENENENQNQQIIHSQEEPVYLKEYIIRVQQPIDSKVYVIDDGSHCTMLLAEEY